MMLRSDRRCPSCWTSKAAARIEPAPRRRNRKGENFLLAGCGGSISNSKKLTAEDAEKRREEIHPTSLRFSASSAVNSSICYFLPRLNFPRGRACELQRA